MAEPKEEVEEMSEAEIEEEEPEEPKEKEKEESYTAEQIRTLIDNTPYEYLYNGHKFRVNLKSGKKEGVKFQYEATIKMRESGEIIKQEVNFIVTEIYASHKHKEQRYPKKMKEGESVYIVKEQKLHNDVKKLLFKDVEKFFKHLTDRYKAIKLKETVDEQEKKIQEQSDTIKKLEEDIQERRKRIEESKTEEKEVTEKVSELQNE